MASNDGLPRGPGLRTDFRLSSSWSPHEHSKIPHDRGFCFFAKWPSLVAPCACFQDELPLPSVGQLRGLRCQRTRGQALAKPPAVPLEGLWPVLLPPGMLFVPRTSPPKHLLSHGCLGTPASSFCLTFSTANPQNLPPLCPRHHVTKRVAGRSVFRVDDTEGKKQRKETS